MPCHSDPIHYPRPSPPTPCPRPPPPAPVPHPLPPSPTPAHDAPSACKCHVPTQHPNINKSQDPYCHRPEYLMGDYPNVGDRLTVFVCVVRHITSHTSLIITPLLPPTGSVEKGVLRVGSIPVAILPSCQHMKPIVLQLHKHENSCVVKIRNTSEAILGPQYSPWPSH